MKEKINIRCLPTFGKSFNDRATFSMSHLPFFHLSDIQFFPVLLPFPEFILKFSVFQSFSFICLFGSPPLRHCFHSISFNSIAELCCRVHSHRANSQLFNTLLVQYSLTECSLHMSFWHICTTKWQNLNTAEHEKKTRQAITQLNE